MKFKLIIFSVVIVTLFSCNNKPKVIKIEINDLSILDSVFIKHKSSDSASIPPIFVNNMSASIKDLTIAERKKTFVKILLANILLNNNNILLIRDSIIDITNRISTNKTVSKKELDWLNGLYKTYRCASSDKDELLKKVDLIPPSMAISQTIVESGWGTSRFAIQGNSLFGEHFSNGAVGNHISANGSDIKLKAFPTIYQAVKSYAININRHRAYRDFRDKRFIMRSNNIVLNSLVLVETLGSYSELGDEYIAYIKDIINRNYLQKYDSAMLNEHDTWYYVNILN